MCLTRPFKLKSNNDKSLMLHVDDTSDLRLGM